MARMIPHDGPNDTKSRAEENIYVLLKNGLPKEYTVIHSLPWLCSAVKEIGQYKPVTGEIDFLIVHQELGLLALEVKGGQYRIEGTTLVPIHSKRRINPLMQMRNNAHGLARWLGVREDLRLRIGYAIAFPDTDFNDISPSPALRDVTTNPPQDLFIDKLGMAHLTDHVIQIMRYWKAALGNPPLSDGKLQLLLETICPEYDGSSSWGRILEYDRKQWLRLTEQQHEAVARAHREARIVINGWPGTGKTLIGISVARKWMEAGKKILFITFNRLLADFLALELESSRACSVYTWHGLGAMVRKRLGLPINRDKDWFNEGCHLDVVSAIERNLLDDYDALVIDEAQALRPAWCQSLISWFGDKPIVALCDETQVFPFEKDHTSVAELCTAMGTASSFALTNVVRMPKAVTARLQVTKPPTLQITTPRELEPDTLKEIMTDDPFLSLNEIIGDLQKQGLKSDEITVLSNCLEDSLDTRSYFEGLGATHCTVAKFRGMESPAVIVFLADRMTDEELFSAYSRSTTVCFALYEARESSWVKGQFHTTFLDQSDHKVRLRNLYQASLTSNIMGEQMAKAIDPLQTVRLAWSPLWKAWLLELQGKSDPACGWIDYLATEQSHPIFHWYVGDQRTIFLTKPASTITESLSSAYLNLEPCTSCNATLPHDSKGCVMCHRAKLRRLPDFRPSPSLDFIDQLRLHDATLHAALDDPAAQTEKISSLPLSLAAVGARLFAIAQKGSTPFLSDIGHGGSILYGIALSFVQSRIALLPPGRQLVLENLNTHFREKYQSLAKVDPASWKNALGLALNLYFQRGYLNKIEKGHYVVTPKASAIA